MERNQNNRRGYTLIEAMAAIMVLAVATGGILLPFSSAASCHVEGSRRTIAAKLAADLLEEITVSLENASDADYEDTINAWDSFSESEGNVTKAWRNGTYSGEVYKYFSRQADCLEASLGSGRNVTVLGAWVTVTVRYEGREMATLKTLVNTNKQL